MKSNSRRSWIITTLAALFMLTCCWPTWVMTPISVFGELGGGWVFYLRRHIAHWQPNAAALIWSAAGILVLAGTVHACGKLYRGPSLAPWRWKSTIILVCGCGLLMGVTIAAQAFWRESLSLFTGRDPIMHDEMGARDLIPRSISRSHLRHVANEATDRLEEKFGALPAGGEFDELGTPLHSWCTALLSFQEAALHNQIRRDLPWHAPENRPAFETPVGLYLIPAFGDSKTSDGYAVSHYAANAHVLGPNTHLKTAELSDGAAQTLLVGEASKNCRAWGDPRNWRDPALGINTSPEGFGAPWSLHGCQFVFVDGHVKFLSEKIDRALLHKLATPNGGEEIKPHELP